MPILKNKNYADSNRALVWHYPDKWIPKDGPGINYFSAIRQGKWKLVYNMRQRKTELYDLSADIGEQNDLASIYPQKAKQLAHLLSERLRAAKAPMPSYKANNKTVPFPDEL